MTVVPWLRSSPLWAFVSYLILTALLTDPLVRQLGTALPSDPGDPILNAWILWWNTQALPLTDAWWNAPIFHPVTGTLTFSETLLGILPISGPVQWWSGNPVLAYNVAFFLSYPLSGLAAYWLGYELTGRHDVAWIAGLLYGFAPYRVDQIPHLQVLSTYWLPIVLVALHRYLRDGGAWWLALFGTAYVLQGLSNAYLFLFVPVLVGLWVLWFVPFITRWRAAAAIAVSGVCAGIVASPVLLRYEAEHRYFGFARGVSEISTFSADMLALLSPSPRLAVWGSMDWFYRPEGQLFPGLTIVVLLGLGLWRARWPSGASAAGWIRVLRLVFGLATIGFTSILVVRLLWGPLLIAPFGLFDVSVTRLDKPFSFAMLFATAWVMVSPVVVSARAQRSVLGFYLLATVWLWILTWGPFPSVMDEPVILYAPFSWLRALPGFDGLRVPSRFWILALVTLTAAASVILARLIRPDAKGRYVLMSIIGVAVLADGWMTDMPMAAVPPPSPSLERLEEGAVMELPLGRPFDDVQAMYRSIYHGRPVVNGFSGHAPGHYAALEVSLTNHDRSLLDLLANLGVRDIRVDRAKDRDGAFARYVAGHKGTKLVAETAEARHYRLAESGSSRRGEIPGDPVPIAAVTANVNNNVVGRMIDGDVSSRWESGPQHRGHTLTIDLGAPTAVGAVVIALGPYTHDFPRLLRLDVSDDGQTWTPAWHGPTAELTIRASLRDPASIPLQIPCHGCRTRFLRLTQQGVDPIYYWSVAELSVLGAEPSVARQ